MVWITSYHKTIVVLLEILTNLKLVNTTSTNLNNHQNNSCKTHKNITTKAYKGHNSCKTKSYTCARQGQLGRYNKTK